MFNHYGAYIRAAGIVIAIVIGLIGGCTPQLEPANQEGMPVPTSKMVRDSGKPLDTLGEGYSLFQAHCAQCHQLVMPKNMRVEQWHAIAPGMAWNLGLKNEDQEAVMTYLVAARQQMQKSN